MLWVVELIGVTGRRSILCGAFSSFALTHLYLPLFISVMGCQALSAISRVSILELAANSGSSRMSQASNLHLETQLLIANQQTILINEIFLVRTRKEIRPVWCCFLLYTLRSCQINPTNIDIFPYENYDHFFLASLFGIL